MDRIAGIFTFGALLASRDGVKPEPKPTRAKPIKQSVINTFNRVGIPYETLDSMTGKVWVDNPFGGGAETSKLVAACIAWVYRTAMAYERGNRSVKVADFDRIRYFILDEDSNAYRNCID